jgi:Rab5 GDP/GTP exchange factor
VPAKQQLKLQSSPATGAYGCMSPPRHSTEGIENIDDFQTDSKSESLVNEVRPATKRGLEEENGDTQRDGSRQISDNMTSRTEESKLQVASDAPGNVVESGNLIDISEVAEGNNESTKNELTAMLSLTEDTPHIPDEMSSSTATLRPEPLSKNEEATATLLPPSAQIYLDPTPKTPGPSRSTSSGASIPRYSQSLEPPERSPTRSDAGFDERPSTSEDEREADSRSEIQSIMDQFSEEGGGPGVEEVMSPRLEFAGPLLGNSIQHPPRKSSLEPMNPALAKAVQSVEDLRLASISPPNYQSQDDNEKGPAVPPKPGSIHSFNPPRATEERLSNMDMPMSPTGATLHRPPPPDPEPEPDLPFDFHRFLEQLRHRTADPVAKFLRSFLQEFGKKQWMVHEQVKIIGDFLAFITNKMAQCEVWRDVSDAEFDNAREGMEKLVMNRLYTQTFSPAIPPPQPIPGGKSKRKSLERPLGPGRRGQHQEDVERDDILAQKVSIYGWVKEEHLDIAPVGESGRRFLVLAQQGMGVFCSHYTSELILLQNCSRSKHIELLEIR